MNIAVTFATNIGAMRREVDRDSKRAKALKIKENGDVIDGSLMTS